MAELQGTIVTSPLVPGGDSDNRYPTHLEDWGQGGYRSVKTTVDRNAIPKERRKAGMLVNVLDDGVLYELLENLVDWREFSGGSGSGSSGKWLVVPEAFVNLPDGSGKREIDSTFPQTTEDPDYALNYFSKNLNPDTLGFIAYSKDTRPSPTGTVFVYPFVSFKVGGGAENIMFVDLYRGAGFGNPTICNFTKVSGSLGFRRTPLGGNSWYRMPYSAIALGSSTVTSDILGSWQSDHKKSISGLEEIFNDKLFDNRVGGFFYNSLGDDVTSTDYKYCLFTGNSYSVDSRSYEFSILDLSTGLQHTWKRLIDYSYTKTVSESSIGGLPGGGNPGQTLIAGPTGKAVWTDRILDLDAFIGPLGTTGYNIPEADLTRLVDAYETGIGMGYIRSYNVYCPITIQDISKDKRVFQILYSFFLDGELSQRSVLVSTIDKTKITESAGASIKPLTQEEYDAISTKSPGTLYVIKN